MRLVVTGATGFVGRSLCQRLREERHRGWEVRRPASAPSAESSIEWIRCDLHDRIDFGDWPGNIEAVVHLAQSARYREFPEGGDDVFNVNVRSTFDLLDYASKTGVRQFVFASTGGVVGHREQSSPANTVDGQQPLDFYLTSKTAAELIVESYVGRLSTAILRCFFVYGPGQTRDRLIPRLISNIRSGRPVTLYGETGIQMNPVFIDDAVEAFSRSLGNKTHMRMDVAGKEVMTLREISTVIGDVVRRDPIFDLQPAANPSSLVGDIASAQYAEPRITFAEGIRRTVEWESNRAKAAE